MLKDLVVTNTYESPLIDVTMTKIWVGEIEDYPTISIQLFRNGVAFGDPIDLVDGATSYTWESLALTDEFGELYEYTVDEVEIPEGFFRLVDGMEITNILVELPDTGGEDPEPELPDTGGINSNSFYMIGLGAALAGALLILRRRKED